MTKKHQKIVFISDFDGTISKEDFFHYVVNNLLTPEDLQPWKDFLDKKITHIDALIGIFSKIRLTEEDFKKFILELPIEESFVETVYFCRENNIDIYVLSAGADYYIKLILKHYGVSDLVTLYTNKSSFDPETGLNVIKPDADEPFYSYKYGIDKEKVVNQLNQQYDFSIFAGDGKIDLRAARLADVIFARAGLLELCNEQDIEVTELKSYKNILDYLKSL